MRTHTIEEAEKKNLVQLTVWVNHDLKDWIESEHKRLTENKKREVMVVEFRNRFSIYVNDLTDGK